MCNECQCCHTIKRIGFYPGSFDPFTYGHLHIVKEAVTLFDKVYIGLALNPDKSRRYGIKAMENAIREVLISESLDSQVEVVSFSGLSYMAAQYVHASTFIRGLRNGTDYEYEENLAKINQEISGIKTIYLRAGDLGVISSSMVMELISHNVSVSKYVPEAILKIIT